MRCRIPTYTGVVLTAQRGAPHLFVARYDTRTLLWRVRGAHKELGRSCLLVLDCSGAWRDIGSYVRCAVLPMLMSVLRGILKGRKRSMVEEISVVSVGIT